ncbi:hypothetical protein C8A03DRAFT_11899 [Achaetomium macrosporum]|uniref:UspA domain-containing protein n=1 Tax=Achaetomium macrosporum TaxID=79813 RepID=A0AAN7CIC8_9PEZI|nr:hypothetical protein C8A03DRAFT_11899 [Achaetomium macrosporum]
MMAETTDNVARLISPPTVAKSPDSDVSPCTNAPSASADYFTTKDGLNGGGKLAGTSPPLATVSSTTTLTSISEEFQVDGSRHSSNDSGCSSTGHRKSSAVSVTFRPPLDPSLPQGQPRRMDNRRLRESSPSPVRFQQHVGFDNLPVGEATKNNPSSFTLQARHRGYHPSRRSRTFMIGIDEHAYSDYALVWLLNNMVDDGDEVVCVRVLEGPLRPEKNYQEEARKLLEAIQAKNELNRAISIVLEYSVGKLHDTFRQLLGIYNPSMLVVGTKGRSLGGIQGLMNTRNSFSKYCLQYSPIPVVVVRPDDKRLKKKEKRSQDPSRQSYAAMLAYNSGKHEADSDASSVYEFEKSIPADEEAHRVAAAIGLPAAFDPTIKPYNPRDSTRRRSSPSTFASATSGRAASASPPLSPLPAESGDEESGDEEDDFEIEAVSARQHVPDEPEESRLERQRKERLHAMEVSEAAALLKSGKSKEPEDDDEDDESQERGTEDASRS